MNKRSYFLGITAMLVLLLALLTGTALAADEEIAGADFNDGKMHWSINADHVLTISGTGEMPNYTSSAQAPWYSYRNQIESIIVGDGITALGDYAFYYCSTATSVSLPTSLNALGKACFLRCSELKIINIPEGVAAIPGSCFYECSSLESIDLPDSVRTFGDSAFYNCSQLKSITIPEGVTELTARSLFSDCTSLKFIMFPNTLRKIGSYDTFWGDCISSVHFNGTLKQWLKISFGDSLPMQSACSLYIDGEKLTNLTIPEDITNISNRVFQCVQLNSVTIPDSVTSIGSKSFYRSSVSIVRIADSVTSVETNAFANCSNLKKVYYVGDPSKWSSIAWSSGNDSLIDAKRQFVASFDDIRTVSLGKVEHGTLTLSDVNCVAGDEITVTAKADPSYRLKTILVNGEAISGSSFIAEKGVDYVVSAEFEYYRGVKDHGTWGDNVEWILYDNNELLIQGTGLVNWSSYPASYPWLKYKDLIESATIGEGITSLPQFAFDSCSHLSTVELPASLTSTGCTPFSNSPLSSIYYNGTVADWLNIEFGSSFFDSSNRTNLYIDGTLVADLVIPDGITEIPAYVFRNYNRLTSVEIPEGAKVIGTSAFEDTNLTHVVLPASIETIASDAFDCNLSYAEFKGDAPTIGSRSFGSTGYLNGTAIYYHTGTTGWTSPKWNDYYASCLEIDNYNTLDENNCNAQGILFTLNPTAKTATVGNGSSSNNNSGYYGAQMGAVAIPDTVIKDGVSYQVIGIGKNAFYQNSHVTSVTIGANVSSVIPSAFAGCTNLKEITVDRGNQYFCSSEGVLYDIGKLYLYVYPAQKTEASFTVPDTVKTIGQYAFYGNSCLTSIVVGKNVTSIYAGAFFNLSNLSDITLPFIGTSEKDTASFREVFCIDYVFNIPESLKRVHILDGKLSSSAFSDCSSIEEVTLPAVPSEIPHFCFSGCSQLKKLTFAQIGATTQDGALALPEGIESIESSAFSGCKNITSVTLPATLTELSNDAFRGSGIRAFQVPSGNKNFSTDQWGVLYNADKTELIQYPAGRPWPYYNVLDTATRIGDSALCGCNHLVNLYIPNQVTSISSSAVYRCPNLTICCFMDSKASDYARSNSLTAWYMDNRTLQGIKVYSLPEQSIQSADRLDLEGLYIVGDYQGKELQIDNYTLSYDNATSGNKTVTVNFDGKTATFEMVLYTSGTGDIIAFDNVSVQDGQAVYIAVYDKNGAMLTAGTAITANGKASIQIKPEVSPKVDHAKLFVLDSGTYTPIGEAQLQQK